MELKEAINFLKESKKIDQLKSFKLERTKTTLNEDVKIGKKMADFVWFHKNYTNFFIEESFLNAALHKIPEYFNYNIIRYNSKTHEIVFLNSPDFDKSHEPIIADFYRVEYDPVKHSFNNSIYTPASTNNPLIYHHKWMFVADDYNGFNVEESKQRSLDWKTILGVNKEVSNKIGRLNFWNEWLKENNLQPRENIQLNEEFQPCWDIYTSDSNYQSVSSANTARKQLPAIFNVIKDLNVKDATLLDIGCGRFNEMFKESVEQKGMIYYGCDPFNKPKHENLEAIKHCQNGKADFITINNVLNTIPLTETDAHLNILKQAYNAISKTGAVFITIYEGEMNAQEKKIYSETGVKPKELTPISTRDGFQNRAKIESYLPLVQELFPFSRIETYKGKKFIIAHKNPQLILRNILTEEDRKQPLSVKKNKTRFN